MEITKVLFGYTSEEAEIVDVGLQNVDITNAYRYIGSLVGWNNGTITNCYATGNITGNYYTGGLVGHHNLCNNWHHHQLRATPLAK
jgi:hypothetical protein